MRVTTHYPQHNNYILLTISVVDPIQPPSYPSASSFALSFERYPKGVLAFLSFYPVSDYRAPVDGVILIGSFLSTDVKQFIVISQILADKFEFSIFE